MKLCLASDGDILLPTIQMEVQFVHVVDNLWLHDIAISLYIFLIIDSLLANATAGSSKQYNPCHTNKDALAESWSFLEV